MLLRNTIVGLCIIAVLTSCSTETNDTNGSTSATKIEPKNKVSTAQKDDCSKLKTLYDVDDAKKELGGDWIGTDEVQTKPDLQICSYAIGRTNTKNPDGYDFLTLVTSGFSSNQKALSAFQSKKGNATDVKKVAGIGDDAFLSKVDNDSATSPGKLTMLKNDTILMVDCETACTSQNFESIGRVILGRY